MKPITAVFFGRSGSGKGTQAELLIKKLKELDPANRVVYVETGAELRKMKANGTHTAKLTAEIMDKGGLMPASIPIWAWSNLLMSEVATGKEHMVFDGVARRADEAPILDQALQFYAREKPSIVFLDVPVPEVTDRLLKRGRHDDKHEKIAERLRWFETDVMPSVHYFKKSPTCRFLEIDGHQTVEKVHADILKALGL
ncbi:MAG: nucleoside monophosphate kinase [Candidatus Taylorbacteria bacterium]|nr:nucleoside monophosphate kinase [Candidatus Taylorbacteria bacterium]